MKNFLTSLCVAVAALAIPFQSGAQASDFLGIGNHVGASVSVGTTGVSIEAATTLTPFVQPRLGISIMPGFHLTETADIYGNINGHDELLTDVDLTGSLKRVQGHLIFNVYPLGDRFPLFIAVGGYFGGRDMVKINGQVHDYAALANNAYVEIGDYQLPVGPNGEIKGGLRTNAFRPYFGIGTGRACPKGRVNFFWELGIQIQGKPYVWDEVNKCKVNIAEIYQQADDDFQKIMNNFKVYPVLKFGVSVRLY